MSWSLGSEQATFDCDNCSDGEKSVRCCPEPSTDDDIPMGLNCTRKDVHLKTCPRNYLKRNLWAGRILRYFHHYRLHDRLPLEPGGVDAQDKKTLDAIEECERLWAALEQVEIRKAGAKGAPVNPGANKVHGEGFDNRGELPPHKRGLVTVQP